MKTNRFLPPANSVKTVLRVSRLIDDPRAAAAVSLMLSLAFTFSDLRRLLWSEVDLQALSVVARDSKKRPSTRDITRFLAQQLRAVQNLAKHKTVFAKPTPSSPTLAQLLRSTLDRAGLTGYAPLDLARWSRQQSQAVRLQVATV